jgi:hypothetical protein
VVAGLLLDGRLKQPIAKFPPGANEMAFLPAILSAALPKIRSIRQEPSVAAGNCHLRFAQFAFAARETV